MRNLYLALALVLSTIFSNKLLSAEVLVDVELPQTYSRMALSLNTDHSQLPGPVDAVWLKAIYNDDKSITLSEYIVPVDFTDGIVDGVYVPSTDPNLITTENRPAIGTSIQASNSPTFDTYDVVSFGAVVDGIYQDIMVPYITGLLPITDIEMSYLYGRTYLVVEEPPVVVIKHIHINGGTEGDPAPWGRDDIPFTIENLETLRSYFVINGEILDEVVGLDQPLVFTVARIEALNHIGPVQLAITDGEITGSMWIDILPIVEPLPFTQDQLLGAMTRYQNQLGPDVGKAIRSHGNNYDSRETTLPMILEIRRMINENY